MIEIAISKVNENEYKYLEVNSFDFIDKDGRQYKLTSADFFYESLQLMLINEFSFNNNNNNANRILDSIDKFRQLIGNAIVDSGNNWISHIIKEQSQSIINLFFEKERSEEIRGFIETEKEATEKVNLLYNAIENVYNKSVSGNEKIEYTFKANGCVAFAIEKNKKELYYSLSGAEDDYTSKIKLQTVDGTQWEYSKKMKEAYSAITKILKRIYRGKYEIIACHLKKNTCRYVNPINEHSNDWITDTEILPNSISLEDDCYIQKANYSSYQPNTMQRLYSCCEKKILAYITQYGFVNNDYKKLMADPNLDIQNFLSNFRFVIRKKPCEHCKPALVGCKEIICGKGNILHHIKWDENKKKFDLEP